MITLKIKKRYDKHSIPKLEIACQESLYIDVHPNMRIIAPTTLCTEQ